MNTKIYYYLIGLLVLGIIWILVLQNDDWNLQDTVLSTTETWTVINSWAIVDTWSSMSSWTVDIWTQNNSLVYTNTEYGFQLTLPEGWEGYKVFVYNFSGADINVKISITLPTNESNRPWIPDPNKPILSNYDNHVKWYADMFIVWVWMPEEYKKEQQRCTPNPDPSCMPVLNLLWNNNNYYFTSIWLGDMPTDLYARRWDWATNKYTLPIFKSLK